MSKRNRRAARNRNRRKRFGGKKKNQRKPPDAPKPKPKEVSDRFFNTLSIIQVAVNSMTRIEDQEGQALKEDVGAEIAVLENAVKDLHGVFSDFTRVLR